MSLAKKIRIRLQGNRPINPNLDIEVPNIDLYFDITNLTNFNLVLDRLLIELWFGQPTLNGAMLQRYEIPANNISKTIYFRADLTQKQCEQIRKYLNNAEFRGSITLHVTGYLESKIGLVEVKEDFERSGL